MRTLKEALISKDRRDWAHGIPKCFVVLPFSDDCMYINNHPHWIEMTLFWDTEQSCATAYIFNKRNLKRDIKYFHHPSTVVYASDLSEDKTVERLEKIRFKGHDFIHELAEEPNFTLYLLDEAKKLFN